MAGHVEAAVPGAGPFNRPCIYRDDGRMWCQDRDTSELMPRFEQDMAVCGERLDAYRVTQFGPGSGSILERKKLLDGREPRRAVERTKWAWLSPTVVDLALFSEGLACQDKAGVEAFLLRHGYTARQPHSQLEHAGVRLSQDYHRKELANAKPITLVIRSPDEAFFIKNPADRDQDRVLIWVTLHFRTASPHKMSSKEYWIDCRARALKLQSDYWDEQFRGFTLPGRDQRWGNFDGEPLAVVAQQILCSATK